MRITLATLATPTDTSDLHEFALNDMSELYETRVFASADAAVAWGQSAVDTENNERATWEEAAYADEWRLALALDTTEDRPNGTPNSVRFVWWTPAGTMGTSEPSNAYCLRIWEQEIGI